MPPVMEAPARDPEPITSKDVAELHLLIGEMKDELSAYRWREAVWISIVFHVVLFLAIIFVPKWIPKSAVIIPLTDQNKDVTFVFGPKDRQKVEPPKTALPSDQNRVAQSRNPQVNKDLLRKLLDMQRPGPPARTQPPSPPAQQQAMQQAPQTASSQPQAGAQNQAQSPPQPAQQAQLQTPQQQRPITRDAFRTHGPGIDQQIQSAGAPSQRRFTFTASGGDFGSNRLPPNTNIRGDVEILSDTMGVDFGPYLQRILFVIRNNWINNIPEGALMKKGKLAIQFSILKNGRVTGMQGVFSSGDVTLDRAAWGGITHSDPLDPLPAQFPGTYLELRIIFLYNLNLDGTEIR